jgi:hypothetical protein
MTATAQADKESNRNQKLNPGRNVVDLNKLIFDVKTGSN